MAPIRVLVTGKRLSEDLLIWENLARGLAASVGTPTIVIHGAGEMTERNLEGDGHDAARVLAAGRPAGALELALRRENRHITMTLTDHGVPSVGFLGTDRGILRWSGPDPSATLEARLNVLARSASLGVVPVLGALALEHEGTKPAQRAPPALAEIIEAAHDQTDFVPFWVGWVVPRAPTSPVLPGNVREWSGEARLPRCAVEGILSLRVLGVSDVSSSDPAAGVHLKS